ncbi:hypothetical protein Aperf_G00000048063 [Anoplocephala perfoliata]
MDRFGESTGSDSPQTKQASVNEFIEQNCVKYVDLEPLEIGISRAEQRSEYENLSRDHLQTLLGGATAKYLTTRTVSDVQSEAPAVDLEFPITHGYYLQLDDLIPLKLNNSTYNASSNNSLRPTTRLLCRIGRSLVAEQYRRIMPDKMQLHGVRPLKMSQTTHTVERERLQRTLSGAGVATSRLRWNWKDLGALHELTCVKSGCCFETNSYEGLVRHLRMGHYRMEEVLKEAEGLLLHSTKSPCLYYPVNPARMRGVQSTRKNYYFCQRCDVYFDSVKSIQTHNSATHHDNGFEVGEAGVFKTCSFCGELLQRESPQIPICQLHLKSSSPTLLLREIGRYLPFDPARAIGAHVLASLMLYPNEHSPLLFEKCVADRIQSRCEQSLGGLSQRLIGALSAFLGTYHFSGLSVYTRVLGKAVDIEEMDLQLRISSNIKRRYPGKVDEDEKSKKSKKPRILEEMSAMVEQKEQIHRIAKTPSDEALDCRKKIVVVHSPFSGENAVDLTGMNSANEEKDSSSSQQEFPSILRVIRPAQESILMSTSQQSLRPAGAADAGSIGKNPLTVGPQAMVAVSRSFTLPGSSNSMIPNSLAFRPNTGTFKNNATVNGHENKWTNLSFVSSDSQPTVSGTFNESKTVLSSLLRRMVLPEDPDSAVKVTSTLQPVICSTLDSSKSSKALHRVVKVPHLSPRPNSEFQKQNVLRIPKSSEAATVKSTQNSVPIVSTETTALCGAIPPISCLSSKILGANLTHSNSRDCPYGNPQSGECLHFGQRVATVPNRNSIQLVRKSLSRSIAEEVAKRVVQSSVLREPSFAAPEMVSQLKQQLPTIRPPLMPNEANLGANKDVLNYGNISSLKSLRLQTSCARTIGESADNQSTDEIQPAIIRRRRPRSIINMRASNGENSSEFPDPSYPFESPESVNLIRNWLKRSGTDITKVKPSEIPQDIADFFARKNARVSDADCERKDKYFCRFCNVSFERIEILWAHCVKLHPEKKFSLECSLASPPNKSDSICPATSNVIRTSANSSASNKESSCYQHLPNSSGDTDAVVAPLSIKRPQLLRGKRLERELTEQRRDRTSGQPGFLGFSNGDGSGELWKMPEGEDEMSLMCPMCSFSSTCRDDIMKHVVERH